MPKSYELKLREVEERRRPRPKEELYKAIEGQPQKILLGFDHPETLQLEMQLTWVEDTFTIDQLHDHLISEVRRLDAEYRRKPLRCDYSRKYVWFDRFVLRPRVQGRELTLQDYGIEPGYRVKVNQFYTSEQFWGQPIPQEPHKQRTVEQMEPCEDQALLVRLDRGSQAFATRIFFFPWLGGSSSAYIPVAQKMPKDVACFALELPGRATREDHEGYPDGKFAIQVMALTLLREMKKPGANFVFAHSQGTHFAYYVVKLLRKQYNISINCMFVSSFPVPVALPPLKLDTLRDRQNFCVPLRIFNGLVRGGWGLDPKMGYKSHMGSCAYQSQELWPVARTLIADWWLTKEFPLPGADIPLDCPLAAFCGKEDLAVPPDLVSEWRNISNDPASFELFTMDGGHLWFQNSSARCEELASTLSRLMKRF
eukprot:TRINITY_DN13440_c2_g1_i1.p1 TRINITY_DN13440_c2_g1~~TRINITY_DN13440_c2_g1_i1.p1  ORF type:complete len:425 (-),score=61.56 TRINITY_DN13440_c2_g1_i1:68-1342(-)